MNPYQATKFSELAGPYKINFRNAFLFYVVTWPFVAISVQVVDGVCERTLGRGGFQLSDFTTRNVYTQIVFLLFGASTCVFAAYRDRKKPSAASVWNRIWVTLAGVFIVLLEITVFHPPSA